MVNKLGMALSSAVVVASLGTVAQAGTCPEEHVLTEPRELEGIPQADLRREVIANVRLEGWRDMGGFLLRMRRLELQPGGTIPTHSHADRPAIVYVAKGTAIEHNSFCAVPIEHVAGTVTEEFGHGYVHWWENKGNEVVTFISTDVVPYDSPNAPYVGFEK